MTKAFCRPAKDEMDMFERTPKKITVYKNGSTSERHLILLNKRATIQISDLLRDIGEMFGCQFEKLFTPDGRKVRFKYNSPGVKVRFAATKLTRPFKISADVIRKQCRRPEYDKK